MSLEAKFYIGVAFVLGLVAGYRIAKRLKLSPRDFEYQLSRLNGREMIEVSAVLQKTWQIPDELVRNLHLPSRSSDEPKA
jgi:hypothetical protein